MLLFICAAVSLGARPPEKNPLLAICVSCAATGRPTHSLTHQATWDSLG